MSDVNDLRHFVVYVIRNSVNGKCYVGKTGRPRFRWYIHKCHAKRGAGKRVGESALYRAIRKHGIESFSFEIIEFGLSEDASFERERAWIVKHGSFGPGGYNMSAGGEGQTGFSHSPESKAKMARHGAENGCFGRVWTEEERAAHRERTLRQFAEKGHPFQGRTHTPETRAKLSAAAKGNKRCVGRKVPPRSQEARDRQAVKMRAFWASPEGVRERERRKGGQS